MPRCRALLNAALCAVAVLCLAGVSAGAAELKLATWNLDWLTLRQPGDPNLPRDVHFRAPGDFERLRQYAERLHADVIAVEEVDGTAAAQRVFPPEQYSIHMTHDDVVQRVGVVVRRGLRYDVNPDVTGVEGDPRLGLRSGADITLRLGAGQLRILAVHLKTGCQDARLTRSARRSCVELREQIPALQAWIRARQSEGVPFVVLGDFNRRMDGRDQLWSALRRTAPLLRATEGHSSPCWGGKSFIDHIIIGGPARAWLVPGSLRVLTYQEDGDDWKSKLSDHCPVSVRLDAPG